jgi:tyrosine-specific transport protein
VETTKRPTIGNIISVMFLVAGTCIGGGMLALPVATGINGFIPSTVVMFICFLAMTATALLLLEASLWMEEGVHVNTMATRLLGNGAKVVTWVLFLFIIAWKNINDSN